MPIFRMYATLRAALKLGAHGGPVILCLALVLQSEVAPVMQRLQSLGVIPTALHAALKQMRVKAAAP